VIRGPVVHPALWGGLFVLLTALLVLVPQLTDPLLVRSWALLAALAAASVLVRPLSGPDRARRALAALAVVLPPAERRAWRAEVAAVLAHADDPAERRRQALGFALALPATAACCWRLAAGRR
jgi:hypothetical protein